MKARLALAALAGLALAAAHLPDGPVGIGVALGGLVLVGVGLSQAMRKAQRQVGPLLAAAGLLLLTLWPSTLGGQGPVWSWSLGLACAAGLLACAPAGPVPRDPVPAGAWLRRHALPVAAIVLVLAAFVLAPLAIRTLDDPAYSAGHEWGGPYGPLLAGLPLLASAGALLLAFRALRRAPDAAAETKPEAEPPAEMVEMLDPAGGGDAEAQA